MSTKKQRVEFRRKVEELIKKYGGEPSLEHNSFYKWLMETRHGPLCLIVEEAEGFIRGYLGTVFTYFVRSPPPHRETGCCSYTGKWNFHFYDGHTVERAVEVLEGQFNRIAVK